MERVASLGSNEKRKPRSGSGKAEKFAEFLKKYEKNRLVFVDESSIGGHLHRDHCLALKGKQVYEAVLGLKFERCSIVPSKFASFEKKNRDFISKI